MQCDNTLHFTESDTIQCYSVTIYDDNICEYYNSGPEYFQIQIFVVEGSLVVHTDDVYGHATVFISDYKEPECGMNKQAT